MEALFQSTLPRRERPYPDTFSPLPPPISIHAPAKGATLMSVKPFSFPAYFNPRSREGSDVLWDLLPKPIRNFNPRSREGSDPECSMIVNGELGFQSTLPRRERHKHRTGKDRRERISIHAPAKGATLFNRFNPTSQSNFNPRSREGSDLAISAEQLRPLHFNPRSREGSDRQTR